MIPNGSANIHRDRPQIHGLDSGAPGSGAGSCPTFWGLHSNQELAPKALLGQYFKSAGTLKALVATKSLSNLVM